MILSLFKFVFQPAGPVMESVAQVASAADPGLDAQRGRLLIPQLMENSVTVLRLP